MTLAAAALIAVGSSVILSAQEEGLGILPPPFPSAAQSDLYVRLSSRLIAPCCWGEAVRFHQSPAAARVRAELVSWVQGGASEREIQDRFAREYGERILGEPRGARTVVAYTIPAVCGVTGLAALVIFLRRRNSLSSPAGFVGALPELPDLE